MKYLMFVLKATITLGLIWVVLRNIAMADTMARVRSVSPFVSLGGLVLLLRLSRFSLFRCRLCITSFVPCPVFGL